MKKFKLVGSLLAAAIIATSTPTAIQAESVTYEEQDSGTNMGQSFTGSATVTFGSTPSFTVKIPKTIVLDTDGAGKYIVGVKGQIPSKYTVNVVPDETITMEEENSLLDSIVADVTAGKTAWTAAELNPDTYSEDTNNTIQMRSTDLGKYEGTLNFNVSAEIGGGMTVELKDASDEVKAANHFVSTYDTGYVAEEMSIIPGDVIYTTYSGELSSGSYNYSIKPGYYQCVSGFGAIPGRSELSFGNSMVWSYLGESYQVPEV